MVISMRDANNVDSKAFLVQLIFRIPYLLLIAVTGAVLGSGLYLIIMTINTRVTVYENETKYYIYFNDAKFNAPDYYNDYTWEHEVIRSDLVLGKMMDMLGDGYDRKEVGSMLSSRILADVRFLTVTIKGEDKDKVEKVSKALNEALQLLAEDETIIDINKITQIEDTGVNAIKTKYFTWRAAVFGAVAFLLVAAFAESIKFAIGTRIYTKGDLSNKLSIPALAVYYKKENNDLGKRQMEVHLEHMGYSIDDISYVSFDEQLEKNRYNELRSKRGVVITIPAGVETVPMINETIQNLQIQDITIVGAILTDVNKNWYKMYCTGIKKNKE